MSDLERLIISKLTDNSQMVLAWDMGLREEVFEEPIYRAIYNHITKYWADNHQKAVPTPYVLASDFPGVPIDETVEEATSWLVEALQNRYLENQAQTVMTAAAVAMYEDPREALSGLWQQCHTLVQVVEPRQLSSDMSNIDERRDRYLARFERRGGGMTIGLPELDNHTGGILPGELAAVGAYTKTGKSFFLAHSAVQARRAGYTPVLFTLEQDIDEMEDRVDAFTSGVSYDRLSKGRLNQSEIDQLHIGQGSLTQMGPLYIRRPPRGDRTVKSMVNMARQLGADYLLIDQLSWMDAEKDYRGDKAITLKHSDLIYELKSEISAAQAGEIPCMLAVQLNRKTQEEPRGNHRQRGQGSMENFANTSMIEQTVDLAIGLWRSREMRNNRTLQLDIMGARRCDDASWFLSWNLVDRTEISVRGPVE